MFRENASVALVTAGICYASISAVHAQSMTLYGIVDTGVEYINHANAGGRSTLRMPALTGEMPSRWGIKGNEPLGGGYAAIFTLESGFTTGTGTLSQGGRLFGRQAWVGIDSPYGTVTFGRQYSMLLWASLIADLFGPNIYATSSLDTWLAAPRSDNSLAYKKTFNGFTIGASYSFGRDASPNNGSNTPGEGNCAGSVPGNATACREWSAMFEYDSSHWGTAVAYDRQNGGPGSAVSLFNGLTPLPFANSGDRDSRLLLDAYVKFDKFLAGLLWVNRNITVNSPTARTIVSNQLALEAQYRITPALSLEGMAQYITARPQGTHAFMENIRMTYAVSVRTAVYAQLAFLQNSRNAAFDVSSAGGATPGKGMNQAAAMLGVKHNF
ncbi:porin [Paraburkholderia sp. RL17-347-BIC-D]|uniref:porin n=1 Tax=Paraburkholderia sp. RL17-347-BIC-D TaxID=3031632 RepID=UPI0038BAA1B1